MPGSRPKTSGNTRAVRASASAVACARSIPFGQPVVPEVSEHDRAAGRRTPATATVRSATPPTPVRTTGNGGGDLEHGYAQAGTWTSRSVEVMTTRLALSVAT